MVILESPLGRIIPTPALSPRQASDDTRSAQAQRGRLRDTPCVRQERRSFHVFLQVLSAGISPLRCSATVGDSPPLAFAALAGVGQGQGVSVGDSHSRAIQKQRQRRYCHGSLTLKSSPSRSTACLQRPTQRETTNRFVGGAGTPPQPLAMQPLGNCQRSFRHANSSVAHHHSPRAFGRG
jgi:hypothetical protein